MDKKHKKILIIGFGISTVFIIISIVGIFIPSKKIFRLFFLVGLIIGIPFEVIDYLLKNKEIENLKKENEELKNNANI